MAESEDLSNFLRREKVKTLDQPAIKECIKHIHEMNEYLNDFSRPKFIVDIVTRKKIKVMTRLQATKLIEENIDYLTINKKLKYKIGHI